MTATTARTSTRTTPMLFSRQRQLLQLLDALGGTSGMLDFQKLLFLYCQEASTGEAPYDFVPYKFGAFSFTSYADRRKLIERGLLEDEDGWQITAEGRKIIGRTMDMQLAAFAKRHRGCTGMRWWRTRTGASRSSRPAASSPSGSPRATTRRSRIRRSPRQGDRPCASTIGYEGHTLESHLISCSRAASALCDVRRNNQPEVRLRRTRSRAGAGVGICHEHLPELGIASEQRQSRHAGRLRRALW